MKTLKELKKEFDMDDQLDVYYLMGYKKAIEGILKDIQESEVISVETIEKYLEKLLK